MAKGKRSMTETEKMARQMNAFLKEVSQKQIEIPGPDEWSTELELLRLIKEQYTEMLLEEKPEYKSLPSGVEIPDLFLEGLRRRERELTGKEK